jgi:hypothetical protein
MLRLVIVDQVNKPAATEPVAVLKANNTATSRNFIVEFKYF